MPGSSITLIVAGNGFVLTHGLCYFSTFGPESRASDNAELLAPFAVKCPSIYYFVHLKRRESRTADIRETRSQRSVAGDDLFNLDY